MPSGAKALEGCRIFGTTEVAQQGVRAMTTRKLTHSADLDLFTLSEM
ncbi:MAG: hypothetical protein QOJ51_3176 [Acidobacteriaceae bacterium]|jgi:hypothetical protein|nr:hypothetical protein [Acidobacteriaceae bacterium]